VFRSPASNLASRFSVTWWLITKGKDLDWFERMRYVRMGGVLRVLTFGCWVLASSASKSLMREKVQLCLVCLVGWATMHERRAASPLGVNTPRRRSAILHVSCPGPSVECALPLPKAKSCPPDPRRRLTYPWSRSPPLWQGMAWRRRTCGTPLRMRRGWASRLVGRAGFPRDGQDVGRPVSVAAGPRWGRWLGVPASPYA
jgi:hypothetical protein